MQGGIHACAAEQWCAWQRFEAYLRAIQSLSMSASLYHPVTEWYLQSSTAESNFPWNLHSALMQYSTAFGHGTASRT